MLYICMTICLINTVSIILVTQKQCVNIYHSIGTAYMMEIVPVERMIVNAYPYN